MGRRAAHSEEEGSLDSLLDTMTNVVGILIILMVVTQLNVTDAVKRILRAGADPAVEITPAALADAQTQRAELEKLIADLKAKWAGLEAEKPKDVAAVEDIAKLTEQLRAELKAAETGMADMAKLEQELAQRRDKAAELNTQYEKLSKELADLRARLADAGDIKAPPPKVVTLPNPRQAPEGAQPVTLLVKDEVVTPVDEEALRKLVDTALTRLRLEPNEEGLIDCQKLVDAFGSARLGDPSWIVRIEIVNHRAYIVPERRASAGESVEQLQQASSTYMRMVRKTKIDDDYLKFTVYSDSYDAYIAARHLADDADVPAGWSVVDGGQPFRIYIPGNVNCFGKPAPPPPPDNPPPKPAEPDKPRPKPLPKEEID